jgi:hypothetical protein
VYIVQDKETGEHVQVGRTCLRDFLGIDDVDHIVKGFDFFRELRDTDGFAEFGSYSWSESLRWLLANTNVIIRLHGWASSSAARNDENMVATVSRVWALYDNSRAAKEFQAEVKANLLEDDDLLARKVIEWVRDHEGDSDYMHNLKIAFGSDLIHDQKRVALAISAIAAFHKAKEWELKEAKRKEKAKDSEFVGELGERVRDIPVTIQLAKSLGYGQFGETFLFKFVTDEGDILSWFSSSCPAGQAGERVALTATIKKHNEFNGVNETVVTRAKLADLEA